MSKLDRIRHFLYEHKAGLAIVSDPVTVNYLTGLTPMNVKCSSLSMKTASLRFLFLLLK